MAKGDATDRTCFYCDGPATRIRDGEHIVAQAIGGAATITERSGRLVCHKCNNGVLSTADHELFRRSYLAQIASQELSVDLWQLWDIDHAANNQLIEARPEWTDGILSGIYIYPQIVIESGDLHLRCNPREAAEYGQDKFEQTLVEAMFDAFKRHNSGGKKRGLYFEPVELELIPKDCRLDPRVFTRHTISEIAKKKHTFIVRYKSNEDKEAALTQLSKLGDWKKMTNWTEKPSSRVPTFSHEFDFGQTLRGLVKIGVNLLAAFCTKTPVSREHFSDPIRLVRGEYHPNHQLFSFMGFVPAAHLSEIWTNDKSHAFRLTYVNGGWHVYMSFFGGRLCAFVAMAGPNDEDWQTLDIVAPLKSKDWRLKYSRDMMPIPIAIQWTDLKTLAPTIKMQEGWEKLSVEEVDPKDYP